MTRPSFRTCIGCRSRLAQADLVRLHLDDQDRLRLDRTGPGRGAWLCAATAADCLRTALERRGLDRAMRCRVERPSVDVVLAQLDGRDEHKTES